MEAENSGEVEGIFLFGIGMARVMINDEPI